MLLKFSGIGCSRIWTQNSGHSSLRWPEVDEKAHGQFILSSVSSIRNRSQIKIVSQFRKILTDEIDEARTRSELVTAFEGLEVVRRAARVDLVEHGPDVGQGNLVT